MTRSLVNHHAGVSAEDIVLRNYTARGHQVAARRWRGRGGEVDLILRDASGLIFVEVKKARTFAAAACRLQRRQMDRLIAAASEFVAGEPRGLLTDMRFDLALVDGSGHSRIIENAFGEA